MSKAEQREVKTMSNATRVIMLVFTTIGFVGAIVTIVLGLSTTVSMEINVAILSAAVLLIALAVLLQTRRQS